MASRAFQRKIDYDHLPQMTRARFTAMASPCELLIESLDITLVQQAAEMVAAEAWRIEDKFSRYRDDSVLTRIHQQTGQTTAVDSETAKLLDFAQQCFQLSDGLFDISSGVLREIWSFKEPFKLPSNAQVCSYQQRIGWNKISWRTPELNVPQGMQIDFGGIGKEYAVDRAAALLKQATSLSFLINFGGDLYANKALSGDKPWLTGIENPDNVEQAVQALQLRSGALATSGDVRQHFEYQGKRYGHILNPLTGYPIEGAPRSITVAAEKCTDAGLLSTLAMLQGSEAEAFLSAQGVPYWCQW